MVALDLVYDEQWLAGKVLMLMKLLALNFPLAFPVFFFFFPFVFWFFRVTEDCALHVLTMIQILQAKYSTRLCCSRAIFVLDHQLIAELEARLDDSTTSIPRLQQPPLKEK